jgi:hypothetical protein
MAGLDSERAQKVARKLPAWAAVDADRRAAGLDPLEFPSALSLEQCSSSATALYKATVAAAVMSEAKAPSGAATKCQQDFHKEVAATESPGEAGHAPFIGGSAKRWGFESRRSMTEVIDLTGGLGVDSWAFAQVAERVVYFERSEELAAAAGRNFQRLGAGNIDVRCETVTPQTELPEADLIYADPARRDAAGRKVFLLEDCTPDILTLLPMLLRKAPTVLLKLSPMADLAMLAERLGPALREIHVVECDGEVKEILCLLHRDAAPSEPEILITLLTSAATASENRSHPRLRKREGPDDKVVGKGPAQPDVFGGSWPLREAERFRLSEEREAEVRFAAEVRPGDTLLEPCPALLKAGAFRLPCARWGLRKLAPSTHLYLSPGAKTPQFAPGNEKFASPGAETGQFAPGNKYFKAWRVREVLPFGAAAFKALKRRYPRADVTARNLPLGSAELQKRLGVASGGDVHIFGCRLADGSSVLLVTAGE